MENIFKVLYNIRKIMGQEKEMEIKSWMTDFLKALDQTFGDRVCFVGLQGSYARGEATPSSDVDVVVILDSLSACDIAAYNTMLDTLKNRELICGFLSGRKELMNWETSDLFQFYHDTVPVRGTLDGLLPLIDAAAVDRAIKTGVCNIYHGCVHNMLYEKSEDVLKELYKAASFVVQAICFRQTGTYIRHRSELIQAVDADEKAIVETFVKLKNGGAGDFVTMSESLFEWAGNWIGRV